MQEVQGHTTKFHHCEFDEPAKRLWEQFSNSYRYLETMVNVLESPRAKALALTKLEESYMWVGKAIRDDQIAYRGFPHK